MADNKVLIEFQIVQKGNKISAVAKETDQLTKSQDKAAGSQKKLTKQQDIGYGRQKQGLVQTANSTKNFSKLANTIDGGGGGTSLVGAYATLAANVFAASAAFNALSRAAEFQQLQQGLELIGNQSGRTLSVLADQLRQATDGALSLEQASRGAALGVSGGFGAKELTGLAEIAKGASLALGRDLADAFDRLTRGAIKLEPEILDELGIMVRLDDAVEKYAAQLGKSAGSLSQLERRQAFMNEILEQGALKFGDIAEQVDPTPYQKLGATFGDLVRGIFTFVNETLGLNAVIGILSQSTTALFGVMLLFGSTIASQILPGLANAGAAAAEFASGAAEIADNALEAAQAQEALAKANILAFEGGAKKFQLAQKELALDINNAKARKSALQSLQASERARARNLKKFSGETLAVKEQELAQIRRQITLVKQLEAAEAGQSAARIAAQKANIAAQFAQEQAEITQGVSTGELGLGAAIGASNLNLKNQKKELDALTKTGKKSGGVLARLAAVNGSLALAFSQVGAALKLIAAAFLRFLPIIGAVVAAVGIAIIAFDKIYNTEKVKEFKASNESLSKILETLSDKGKEYAKAQESAASAAQKQIRSFQIVSNTIGEVNAQLIETVKLRKEVEQEAGETGGEFGFLRSLYLNTMFNEDLKRDIKEAGVTIKEGLERDDLKALAGAIFNVQDSAEFASFNKLLESEIPALVEDLGKDFNFSDLFFDGDRVRSSVEVQEILAKRIAATQNKFGRLGDAVSSFNQELINTEKVGSQFLQKFFPKTNTSDILNSVKSLNTGIKNIQETTKDAGFSAEEQTEAIGKALSEAGPNVRKILGSSVRGPIEEIINLRGQIAGLGKEESRNQDQKDKAKKLELKIEELIRDLGVEGADVLESTLATLQNIQNKEILRKSTLEQINRIQKSVSAATKLTESATKVSLLLDKQKLGFKKEENAEALRVLANSANVSEEEIKRVGMRQALIDRQKELVDEEGKEEEILAITLKLAEERNLAIQEEIASATEAFVVEKAKQEILKSQADQKQKILDAEIKIQEISRKTQALELGRAGTGRAQTLADQIANEEKRLEIVRDKAKAEKAILKAQNDIIIAELKVLKAKEDITTVEGKARADELQNTINGIETAETLSINAITKSAEATEAGLKNALANAVQEAFFNSPIADGIDNTMINAAFGFNEDNFKTEGVVNSMKQTTFGLNMMRQAFMNFADTISNLFGDDGKVVSALAKLGQIVAETSLGIVQSFASIDKQFEEGGIFADLANADEDKAKLVKGMLKFGAAAQLTTGVISGFQQVLTADSERRVSAIEQAIALEKKLDGKSAESLAKIAAMEKKKEAMQRKAFERNKKLQIANAIISTASAAATTYAALAENPFLAMAMAAAITALGLAQVAIIKKTQFGGGNSEPGIPNKTSLEIGKRSSAVDVAKNTSSGELNFLRGGNTTGQNLGGAGGGLPGASMGRRGYADGGVIVGERGPEVITPAIPVDVTPNFALGGQPANVNFTINAVDAAGVEDVLMNQRGNIIGMIRDAANENGERFLETVDTQAYGGNK